MAFLDYRSKGCSLLWYVIDNNFPSKQNHTFMADGLLDDTLYPVLFTTRVTIKGAMPPHLATRSDINITDTNKTTRYHKYPWLNKDDKMKHY